MRKKAKTTEPRYSIGEVARKSGVKVTTIRFYEQAGLLHPPPRSAGNRREYDEAALERLRFIRHARDLGFDTSDIRELLELAGQPGSPCDKADAIAQRHLRHVKKRITQLQALQAELAHMLETHRHGRIHQCQVIRALADHEECLHEHHQRIPHIDVRTAAGDASGGGTTGSDAADDAAGNGATDSGTAGDNATGSATAPTSALRQKKACHPH